MYSVINACESARADRGRKANLAKVFTENGIPYVFAMSYKLQISAVGNLLSAFYGSFLQSGSTFAESAAAARKTLHVSRARIGKFGIETELEDVIVPVAYSSCDLDPNMKTTKKVGPSHERSWMSGLRRKDGNLSELPTLEGRDKDVIRLEQQLLRNDSNNDGRILLVSGKYGCGKTALLQFTSRWWHITGWTLEPIYIDMQRSGIETPEQLCKFMVKKHAAKGTGQYVSDESRPLHRLLEEMYQNQTTSEQTMRRPLLILDQFPRVFPLRPWKKEDITSSKTTADAWRSFLADLSSAAAYTIVACHDFPWYIDNHAGSEWPWKTYFMLGSPTVAASETAEQIGGDKTIKGLLKSPRDIERLELVSQWSDECYPLYQAMRIMVKQNGLDSVVKSLQSNANLLNNPGLDAAVRSQKVLRVAQDLWKHCMSIEKAILLSFAPFHGHIPRCHESYVREFCLGRLELRHAVRDWFLDRAPVPTVNGYWSTVNRSTAALVNGAAQLLIVRLKKAGLIQAVAACAPTHMDDDIDPLLRGQAEGKKIHSIHPIFTLFLRQQAHREGYADLGTPNEKTQLLTKVFVEHHDHRVYEWMEGLQTGTISLDTYTDAPPVGDLAKELSACSRTAMAGL